MTTLMIELYFRIYLFPYITYKFIQDIPVKNILYPYIIYPFLTHKTLSPQKVNLFYYFISKSQHKNYN